MCQLRKESVCQKHSIREIDHMLWRYDIIFPNYNEVRSEICRLYNFYYGDNKLIANRMHMNEKQIIAILRSKSVYDYLMYV